MRAIVNTAPDRLKMQAMPLPQPGPGQVRIRTGACGICATDLAMIAGWERTGFPAIPGHEWSGTVDAVGPGGDESLTGHRCVAENVLSDGKEVGFEHPGGYGEYFLTEAANVQLLPDDFPFAAAVLIEPLAVAVRGKHRLGAGAADPVLILGDGPIGLLMVLVLMQESPRRICLVGGRAHRLALATQFGAAQTLNYHQLSGDFAAALRGQAGAGFPTIIEASGSAAAMNAALEVVQPGGKILALGDYGAERANFRWNQLLHREMALIGSNASAGAWPEAVWLAVKDRLPLDALVTHRLPAERFQEGFALMHDRHSTVVKIVMEW
jgi:threonine dehydrogenase-like Zn-dependent dehydrogenase